MLWIFFTLNCLSVPCLGDEKVVVILESEAKIKGDSIYLGEIVKDIKADKALKEKLLGMKVGSSPLPGGRRTLNKDYILVRLYQNEILPGQVLVKGPEEVLVVRERQDYHIWEKGVPFNNDENYIIKRGDSVNLVIEGKALRVVTRGRALEPGKIGDMIEILNTSSFKKIKGKVTAPFTVVVSIPDIK